MKRRVRLFAVVTACLSAAALVPIAMAAPKKPTPSAKKKVPRKAAPPPTKTNVETRKPDARYPYGGRANGKFSGKLVGLAIDETGRFEASLSNGLGVRAFHGCKRRASDYPVVLDALYHDTDPIQLEVSGGCIRKITLWNFR